MQPNRYIVYCLSLIAFIFASSSTFAQLGISFDIPKPKQYEERALRSEKSDSKKFGVGQRFIQNTTTHYNYYFNAQNKLKEIIARAKEMHQDDYTELLPFYNYNLDETQRDSLQLDSVIYKSTSGIALHDLRSDWADNMYLLWGAAYYLKKEFDSAYLTFQFINYAFAPKEKDGYYQYIGSNMDGNSAMSISTREKSSVTRKMFTMPPSRNDAFIWQIRTFLAKDEFAEAASLIAMLKTDPNFPKRLATDLHEVESYYYYKQNVWDSSAFHLIQALDNTTTKNEKGRWEFLAAQMFELSQNYDLAQQYYEKSIGHTLDPQLEVYARLYSIRTDKSGANLIDKNISQLLKMAKQDKYAEYRDIIYYMAAEMELERNNTSEAKKYLQKAAQYDNGNISQRNKIYIQLGELAFANKEYRQAKNSYDSVEFNDPFLKDTATLIHRKEILGKLAEQAEIVYRQDSLQKIAKLPEDERKEFVKQVLKQLRKAQGMKDDGTITGGSGFAPTAPDLFSQTQMSKGEWYFYNSAARQRGLADFRTRWGTRPNVDNWRRLGAVVGQARQNGKLLSNQQDSNVIKNALGISQNEELSYDALYSHLPLTPEQMTISNDSIKDALFELGRLFLNELDDCASMTRMYEQLTTRFSDYNKMDEVVFRLYYCYNRNGEVTKASQLKSLLSSKYPNSKYTQMASGVNVSKSDNATEAYEKIYNLFLEGNFDQALAEKKMADSIYASNYWTPQLLYIEAVYYIKQRQDSTAITSLRSITVLYPRHPLAEKARTMINVLRNRNKIEEELTNIVVEPRPEANQVADTTSMVKQQPVVKTDTAIVKKAEPPKVNIPKTNQPVVIDTTTKKPVATSFSFNADEPHSALIILTKVDGIYANEAKNAFDRYCRGKGVNITTLNLDATNRLLVIKPFTNLLLAGDFALQLKKVAGSQIVPWLTADKYSFSVISDSNLEVLKANPDLAAYKRFLDQNLPGKF